MTTQTPKSFTVQRGTDDAIIIHDAAGAAVEIRHDNQSLADFLNWARNQRNVVAGLGDAVPWGVYFTSEVPLVEYCKRNATLLSVADGLSNEKHLLSEGAVYHLGGVYFHQLAKAIATDSPGAPDGLRSTPAPLFVTTELQERATKLLQSEDSSLRCVSDWPVERAFVFLDISDYSTHPGGQQALMAASLVLISDDIANSLFNPPSPATDEIFTGDGFVYVCPFATDACVFARRLARNIEGRVANGTLPCELHFRIGVHVGPVYRVWDHGRRGWNYIGEGITGARRVLEAIGADADDLVFVSAAVRSQLQLDQTQKKWIQAMLNRGRRKDKHGRPWRVYELNHDAEV